MLIILKKMRLYKTIKYCNICKTKFFSDGEKGAAQYYCKDCFKKHYSEKKK